ncbi:MAG: ornithine--oxo-acid transaminase [Gammaproteobacteria bacterium]
MKNATIDLENKFCDHNYHPLPVVLVRGDGPFVWDDHGRKYLDMMSAYSAVSHGHAHPRLVKALIRQAADLNIVSRAFHTDKLAPFLEKICEMTGQDVALPMNTGAEAVETAIKAARKWAYEVKGVATDQARIIGCTGNFHGRTIAIVGLSSEDQYRSGFGPFPGGLDVIEYGNADALEEAITPETAAFLVEPIQGEGGIVIPPEGYLGRCAEICRRNNVLLICDEVQTGLGRTGRLLASEHDNVKPDGLILGKALGGGILPVSAFLARHEVMDVFRPGDHGSTFGGNPLAAVVALEALNIIDDEDLVGRSADNGAWLIDQLQKLTSPVIREIRGKGLFIGIDIDPDRASAREICERLMGRGLLSKETHETVVRLAPPLIIERNLLEWSVEQIGEVIAEVESLPRAS